MNSMLFLIVRPFLRELHGKTPQAPISGFIRVESGSRRTEKQPTGRGPEGCVENGLAAALLVGYVSIEICALYCQSGSDRLADGPF